MKNIIVHQQIPGQNFEEYPGYELIKSVRINRSYEHIFCPSGQNTYTIFNNEFKEIGMEASFINEWGSQLIQAGQEKLIELMKEDLMNNSSLNQPNYLIGNISFPQKDIIVNPALELESAKYLKVENNPQEDFGFGLQLIITGQGMYYQEK
jgi:hypothetical protein